MWWGSYAESMYENRMCHRPLLVMVSLATGIDLHDEHVMTMCL